MANNNENKILNVPHLRFPEFSGEWKIVKVSELLEFYSTNSLSWEQLDYGNGIIKNLHYGLIHKGLPTMVDISSDLLPYIKSESMPKSYTLFLNGDVAFADASEDTNDVAKAVEIVNCDEQQIVSGLHTIHGRDKSDLTVIGYKGYAFASDSFHKQIRRIAQGTKVFSINVRNFDEVRVGIPSKDEQIKIAKLLRAIDLRIATQNKIIEDLKKLKSAISVQLLSGLFPLSRKEQWREMNLGDITENFNRRNKDRSSYPMYSVTNTSGFSPQNEIFDGKEIKDEDISIYKIIEKGEFAYNPARINVGSIGRYDNEDLCMISSLYICFRPSENIDSDWLLHLLKSDHMIYQYGLYGEGGVRIYLFYPNFSRIKVSLPPLEVQKRIANTLNLFDKKICLETNLLNKFQKQKKHLLSMMFI